MDVDARGNGAGWSVCRDDIQEASSRSEDDRNEGDTARGKPNRERHREEVASEREHSSGCPSSTVSRSRLVLAIRFFVYFYFFEIHTSEPEARVSLVHHRFRWPHRERTLTNVNRAGKLYYIEW